jgi:hypothetical protein
MTEAHQRAYRHPKDKATSGMQNWRAHSKSLRDRGALMLSLTTRPAMPGSVMTRRGMSGRCSPSPARACWAGSGADTRPATLSVCFCPHRLLRRTTSATPLGVRATGDAQATDRAPLRRVVQKIPHCRATRAPRGSHSRASPSAWRVHARRSTPASWRMRRHRTGGTRGAGWWSGAVERCPSCTASPAAALRATGSTRSRPGGGRVRPVPVASPARTSGWRGQGVVV